jgi:hypothetical protein
MIIHLQRHAGVFGGQCGGGGAATNHRVAELQEFRHHQPVAVVVAPGLLGVEVSGVHENGAEQQHSQVRRQRLFRCRQQLPDCRQPAPV